MFVMYGCDFYDLVRMCWSQAGLSKSCNVSIAQLPTPVTELFTLMLAPFTCTLTCKDVTRGNQRYLQVCMCVYMCLLVS